VGISEKKNVATAVVELLDAECARVLLASLYKQVWPKRPEREGYPLMVNLKPIDNF
jgi:hypothetical protein